MPGEILRAVRIPRLPDDARWGYVKACRKPGDFAHAMAAVLLIARTRRVVIGALGSMPLLLEREAASIGGVTCALETLDGLDHVHGTCRLPPRAARWPKRAHEPRHTHREWYLGDRGGEPRTHLADFLREARLLTGTHLGCEHGVCGACTLLIDGAPSRSCIAYAVACDGADVRTIEGLEDDPAIARLRAAFTAEHALQCGYCTPGMLVTARDIVHRLPDADDAAFVWSWREISAGAPAMPGLCAPFYGSWPRACHSVWQQRCLCLLCRSLRDHLLHPRRHCQRVWKSPGPYALLCRCRRCGPQSTIRRWLPPACRALGWFRWWANAER